jgi:hypothetical protein
MAATAHTQANVVYIPFGLTCVTAYQLQKHGLRQAAYPFDWILCPNFKSICEILADGFSNFLTKEEDLQAKNSSNNFPLLNDDWIDNNGDNGDKTLRVYNKKYKISFLHDFHSDIQKELESVREKYNRRIERFVAVMKSDVKKIIIHTGKSFDHEACLRLFQSLDYKNYEIKFISYDELGLSKDWKYDEYNWKNLFGL